MISKLFVLNTSFGYTYNSAIHKSIIAILEECHENTIANKELGTPAFILLDSVDYLLRPEKGKKKHFMLERFLKGTA
jgi:hypothetical protein